MLAAWVLFPLVFLVVCLGCALLLEAAAGLRLPGPLLPLAGLTVIITAISLTSNWTTTAALSGPVLVILTAAGFGVGWRRLRSLHLDRWAVAVGLVIFLALAAPLILSGNATFLGYYVDNDVSFHLGLADLLVTHGPSMAGFPNDAYLNSVLPYLLTDYPTGADVAFGSVAHLIGQNVAWDLTPYLALALTFGGLGVFELLKGVVRSRPLRSICAVLAGANGLIYQLYMAASIKELVSCVVLTLIACLVVLSLDHLRVRSLLPLAVAVAAAFDVLGVTAVPWLGVPLAVFVLLALWRVWPTVRRRAPRLSSLRALGPGRRPSAGLVVVTGVGLILLVGLFEPVAAKAPTFFNVSKSVLTTNAASALGYLSAPLQKWQLLGIWPDYDFRFPLMYHVDITFVLIGVELFSAVLGLVWLLRRRGWGPLLLLAGNGISALYLFHESTPYAASKVMTILCVAVVLIVTLGSAALHDVGRRIEAFALVAIIAFGVVWTDALAFRFGSVAPSGRLHELAAIDSRFGSKNASTLVPYGVFPYVGYFLRDMQPEAAGNPFQFQPRAGLNPTPFELANLRWDTSNLALSYVQSFRYIVEDGSPAFSRPPSDFRLAYQGTYWNVWERTSTPTVLAHTGFGTFPYSSAVAPCRTVEAMAKLAERDHGRIAYVTAHPSATLNIAAVNHPGNWVPINGDPDELIAKEGPGTLASTISIPSAGRYQVWLDGSFGQKVTVTVGGHLAGSVSQQLGPLQQATLAGTVTLPAGRQSIVFNRPAQGLLVPDGDPVTSYSRVFGPIMLVKDGPNDAVSTTNPQDARALCGQRLQWIEVIR